MRSVVFVHSVMMLLFSNPAMAQSFPKVYKCLSAIHIAESFFEGKYSFSSILLSGNKLGGSMLIATDQGVKIVQGVLNEKDQHIRFVFTPPGQKVKMMKHFQILPDNELLGRWTVENTDAGLSPSQDVTTAKEALTKAGPKTLEAAQERAKDLQRHLRNLESRFRGQDGFVLKSTPNSSQETKVPWKESFLEQRKEDFSKEQEDLKACDGLPDKNIQKAVSIERERLESLQRKIVELGSGPESPNTKTTGSKAQ